MARTTEENEELVRRHFEAINDQNWEAYAETLAEHTVTHQGGETRHGIERATNHLKDFYDAIPDASITINELLTDGDKVPVRITNTGTNDRDLPGIESTGTEIEFSSHLIARVEEGVLAERWVLAERPRPASE